MKSSDSNRRELEKLALRSKPVKLLGDFQGKSAASHKKAKNIYYKNGKPRQNTSETSTGVSKGRIQMGRHNSSRRQFSIKHLFRRIFENLGTLCGNRIHNRQESRSRVSNKTNDNLRRHSRKRSSVSKRRRYISMTDLEAKTLNLLLHVALICYLLFSLLNLLESHRYSFIQEREQQSVKWTGKK